MAQPLLATKVDNYLSYDLLCIVDLNPKINDVKELQA